MGAYEAKNQFSALLEQVEQGGSFVITRHGRPVARLVPYQDPDHRQKVAAAFAVFDRIAGKARMSTDEIVELIRKDRER